MEFPLPVANGQVDVGRLGVGVAVAGEVAEAEIVGEDEDDIGFVRSGDLTQRRRGGVEGEIGVERWNEA